MKYYSKSQIYHNDQWSFNQSLSFASFEKVKLHQGLSAFMNFSLSFTAVSVIPSLSLIFAFGLQTGGPTGIVWGWIVTSIFTCIVSLSMAEICSAIPKAGSVYTWSGKLAPEKYSALASYICGWFNFLGNVSCDSSYAFGCAQIFAAMAYLDPQSDVLATNDIVLVSIVILFIWALKNVINIEYQGVINNISAVIQLFTTFSIVIILFVFSHQLSSPKFVFAHYTNETGFKSNTYVIMISILTSLYGFSGYEGGAHMAEETKNPAKEAPRAIVMTCIISAICGLVYLLGLLFACSGQIDEVIYGENPQAIVNVFFIVFYHQKMPSLIVTIILFMCIFVSGFGSMTVTTRVGYAIARDNGFPCSYHLSKINKYTKNPDAMLILVFILSSALCFLPLYSERAFTAITGITTVSYQISYAIPIWFRITSSRDSFVPSHFNLGKYSLLVGWISAIWLTLTSVIMFLPTSYDPILGYTVDNFNYTIVVISITGAFAFVYWILPEPYGARHFFQQSSKV